MTEINTTSRNLISESVKYAKEVHTQCAKDIVTTGTEAAHKAAEVCKPVLEEMKEAAEHE